MYGDRRDRIAAYEAVIDRMVELGYADWIIDWLAITGGALVIWYQQEGDGQPVIWPGLRGTNRIGDVYRSEQRRAKAEALQQEREARRGRRGRHDKRPSRF
jgi:hypothetical protein